jgi:hypothetical protein
MRVVLVALALSSAVTVAASAQMMPSRPNPLVSGPGFVLRDGLDRRTWVPREAIRQQYIADLKRLRSKALATQRQEGGVLSPVSRTEIQQRLDKINALYQRRLQDSGV